VNPRLQRVSSGLKKKCMFSSGASIERFGKCLAVDEAMLDKTISRVTVFSSRPNRLQGYFELTTI
jgi:hypothetical protein